MYIDLANGPFAFFKFKAGLEGHGHAAAAGAVVGQGVEAEGGAEPAAGVGHAAGHAAGPGEREAGPDLGAGLGPGLDPGAAGARARASPNQRVAPDHHHCQITKSQIGMIRTTEHNGLWT